ncbi:TPA: transposase [Escherichia coli]|nr:transposase [Escherichia coli]HAN4522979.1 transposase [Escherichia coli]
MRAKERLPRKHYSPEFKMELVRLALEEEGSIAALARKHDVNDNLLFKWIRLWQREGRVCRPRKNSSSLPALIVFVRTGREAGVLIIAELFSEVVTVSQPVPGEQETDITDGIRLSDWYYKYKKSSESNVKDLPE